MSDKRVPRRSLDDWMELVTECRQSGLTDAAWCEAQGISPSCFYNAVSRLRKRACQIPDPIGKASTLDLTSHKQDVVQIAIEPELSPAELFQDERSSSMYLDNSHTIEIEAKGLTIRMSNTVQPMLLKILMDALKEPLCWRTFPMSMQSISFVAEQICVNLSMDYAQLFRSSSLWKSTIRSTCSADANATGLKLS